ncbi:MAG TPA: hypothetical protein H9830_08985 [Candidatus Agrococcus pullicola]|uniref:Uncharacterized protein n=1 Tax=Candidatus Agrococcus pullicola TaxID=2838429 RepID=A0A9D2CA07_9MICO|nr:hypothetical protein [Candidatus Agrococcus pullicola]
MITVLLAGSEQTVTGSVRMVSRMIPQPDTVIGEMTEGERMRAKESGGHPWAVRASALPAAA